MIIRRLQGERVAIMYYLQIVMDLIITWFHRHVLRVIHLSSFDDSYFPVGYNRCMRVVFVIRNKWGVCHRGT